MTRRLALDALRVAGFENDQRAFTRLYVENRVSIKAAEHAFKAAEHAFREGWRLAEARRTGTKAERTAP